MNPSQNNRHFEPRKLDIQSLQRDFLIHEYQEILRRGKWTILFTLLIVTGLVALFTFLSKPVYEASSLVLIDMKSKEGSSPMFDMTGTATANRITNELEILKSNITTGEVARALIFRQSPDEKKVATLTIIRPEGKDPREDSLWIEKVVVERLSQQVDFIPIRESDIIRITARSVDPKEAMIIANTYADVYSARNLTTSRLQSQALREFLEAQSHSKRAVLDSAENELQDYMRSSGVVSLDAEASKVVEQLSQLEAQRDGMEIEKKSRTNALASYRDELAKQEPNTAKVIGESDDSYIRLLQEQLAKLELQRDIVTAQNGGLANERLFSDKLKEVDGQIASLKQRLKERTSKYLNSLPPAGQNPGTGDASYLAQVKQKIIEERIELDALDARVKALNTVIQEYEIRFKQIPRKSIELAKLERARLSSEKLYLLVEEKYNETSIKEKSEFGYVNIMDRAVVPRRPVSPRIRLNLFLGVLLGAGLGIGIVIARSSTDFRIRTPEDLIRHGFIPLSAIRVMDDETIQIDQTTMDFQGYRAFDSHLVAHYQPLGPLAESYRHLRTTVQHARAGSPLRSIVISSSSPKEGKTTTVANLAISFSQDDVKVLLVDGDMRQSKIHSLFDLPNSPGLNEHLFGKRRFEEVIHRNVLPNLDIITGGKIGLNHSEIINSKGLKQFIEQAKERYEVVLFDSPPLLAVTDAAILSTNTDGVIIVAAAMEARLDALEHFANFLAGIDVPLIGVVLNKFDIRLVSSRYHTGYHYGYYGNEYGYPRKVVGEKPTNSFLGRLHL